LKYCKKFIAAMLSIVILILLAGCGNNENNITPESAVNVTVSEVLTKTIEETATYTGELKAAVSTSVSAKVSGNAETIYCEIGDFVNSGDILVKLDDTDYQTQYQQANSAYLSAVSQSKSVVSSAQIEYNNAKINCDNQKILYDHGAISKQAYDSAVTRLENAKINLDAAIEQSGLNSAKAALEAAENSLGYTTVYAPVSGYISSKNASVGQMVSPGVEIFSIKNTDTVNAQINVTESVISKVVIGTKAVVSVDSLHENFECTVTGTSPTKNPQTGLYQINISIDNPDGVLKDGMFADVTLTLSDAADALVVPTDSIFEDESEKKYVYIVKGDTAVKTEVTVGIVTEEYTEIVKGVGNEDTVIVSGKEYLSEKNNKIKIVE